MNESCIRYVKESIFCTYIYLIYILKGLNIPMLIYTLQSVYINDVKAYIGVTGILVHIVYMDI